MKTLAIDSSSMTGSVALLEDEALVGEYLLSLKRTHSERLFPALDALLTQTGTDIAEIDLLAVAVGPGSYTGLRIGLGTAKGLSFALGKPIVGVSTLSALAGTLPWPGPILTLIDARHGNVFAGAFLHGESGPEPLIAEQYAPLSDILEKVLEKSGNQPVLAVGDGAEQYRTQIAGAIPGVFFGGALSSQVRAASVGLLARRHYLEGYHDDTDRIAPMYLRRSEAEVRREEVGHCG